MVTYCKKHKKIHLCNENTNDEETLKNVKKIKEKMDRLKLKHEIKMHKSKKPKSKSINNILTDAKKRNETIKTHNPIDMEKITISIKDDKNISYSNLSTFERMNLLRKKIGDKKTTPKKPEEIKLIQINKQTIGIAKAIAMHRQKQKEE